MLLNHYLPGWVPPGYRVDKNWEGLDGWGWVALPEVQDRLPPCLYDRAVASLRRSWSVDISALRISPPAEHAYREMLNLSRERHNAAALVLLLERSTFRGWYSPSHLAEVEKDIRAWGQEYGVPIIDGRTWIGDAGFADEVHLNHHGAALFTRSLEREVIPLLRGGATAGDQRAGR